MTTYGDTLAGTSSSNSTHEFCNSSDSSSFQPIKTQVTIPTAHVMPSMLDRPLCTVGESSTRQAAPTSSPPNSSSGRGRLMTNQDPDTLRHSQVFPQNHLHQYQASMESSCDQSLLLTSGQISLDRAWTPCRLAAELTFNQSAFLDKQSAGPWSPLQMCHSGTTATVLEKDPGATLDAKPTTEASRNCENEVPLGLNPVSTFSSTTPGQSRMWRQEVCALHPYDSCSLNAWKQHLDHVQLQLEQMQLQNKAACYHPLANNSSLHSHDPAQWVSIVNANENLLREKEILIDRQRQHISQLEQKVRESELQVHSAYFGYPAHYLLGMQELQRENTFLRAQFTEKTEMLSKEKIGLERKLAASEASVKQIQNTHKETVQKHIAELKKREERVKARDKHIEHMKKKCQKESEQNREKQQRIETLERYVADLPTLEHHRKQNQQLKESQQATAALQETLTALQRELRDARANCREKELELEKQKHKEMELRAYCSFQDNMQCGKATTAEGYDQEMKRERQEKDSLQKERDLLRKIVDGQKKKMDQLSSRVKDLEEQVSQEEGTSQALKAEALRQESALQQLRVAVKELSAQNQELIEKNLTFQEHLLQMDSDQLQSGEAAHLTQELHSELTCCVHDLQAVYSVVTQRAQGKDPNLSLLLGIHTVQCSVKEQEDLLKSDTLAKKLEGVKQLRKEIEDLRTAVSDRYAQDMGDNCIAQ